MNQLELILENIRLSHTERLLQEAQTDLELIRGQRLINESVLAIRGALLQENFYDNPGYKRLGYANLGAMGTTIAGGLIGAGIGLDASPEDEQRIKFNVTSDPGYADTINGTHNMFEKIPDLKQLAVDKYGVDYMNQINDEHLDKRVNQMESISGGILGAGAGMVGGVGLIGASLRNPNKTKFF